MSNQTNTTESVSDAQVRPVPAVLVKAPWEWRYSLLNPFAALRPDPVPTHTQDLEHAIVVTQQDLLKSRIAAEYHDAMQQMLAQRLIRLKGELDQEAHEQDMLKAGQGRGFDYQPFKFNAGVRPHLSTMRN